MNTTTIAVAHPRPSCPDLVHEVYWSQTREMIAHAAEFLRGVADRFGISPLALNWRIVGAAT